MDNSRVNLSKKIDKYEEKYIYINGEKILDFTSTNYLGLRDDQRIKEEIKKGVDLYSLSPDINKTIPENSDICYQLINKLKEMTQMDEINVYSSGYNVNVAIITNLYDHNDVIFCDSLNSINILEGVYVSGAKLIRFKHNNVEDLKEKLEKYRSKYHKACVLVDSVFTMDGTKAPLKKIGFLKSKHNFHFFVDESNAIGLYGERESGITEESESLQYVDLMMGYLHKTYGTVGEFAAMKREIDNMLVQNSLRRDLINKSMINPMEAIGAMKAMELAKTERWRKVKSQELADLFRERITKLGFNVVESNSLIVALTFETDREVIDISKMLYDEKILGAITISKTTIESRIRFIFGSHLEREDINHLYAIFKKISKEYYVNMNPHKI